LERHGSSLLEGEGEMRKLSSEAKWSKLKVPRKTIEEEKGD